MSRRSSGWQRVRIVDFISRGTAHGRPVHALSRDSPIVAEARAGLDRGRDRRRRRRTRAHDGADSRDDDSGEDHPPRFRMVASL
jgi:hypothetical protein